MLHDSQSTLEQVENYLDAKEAILDAFIDSNSEHELFIASYIHGHFSVVAANIMQLIPVLENKHVSAAQWQLHTQHMLSTSISEAINNHELTAQDAKDVIYMLSSLFESNGDPK